MTKYVLAFDPGGTTGWSIAQYSDSEPMTFVAGGQIPNGVVGVVNFIKAQELNQLEPWEWDQFTIVSESFVLDGRTKQPDLTPVRIEGALTALLGEGTVTYQRNTKKSLVGDSALREHGFWIPGQRHQMDARMHALAWGKLNHLPTAKAYWPEHED